MGFSLFMQSKQPPDPKPSTEILKQIRYDNADIREATIGTEIGALRTKLRDEDVPVSSAHIIEACRLAETLAAVRGRAVPSLPEYNDAAI